MHQSQVASQATDGYRAIREGEPVAKTDWEAMGIYERIEAALSMRDRKQTDLAKFLGIDPSVVSKAMKRGAGLEKHFHKIADFFSVSMDWVVRGTGQPPIISPSHFPAAVKDSLVVAHQLRSRTLEIPIIGDVTAGRGDPWSDDGAVAYVSDADLCMVRVHGDSGGAVIRDGQFALLAPKSRRPRSGDIVAVQTTDALSYVKRLTIDVRHHRMILTNVDPSAEGDNLTLDEGEVAQIRVVIGCIYEAQRIRSDI
jgi:hypothetical protein